MTQTHKLILPLPPTPLVSSPLISERFRPLLLLPLLQLLSRAAPIFPACDCTQPFAADIALRLTARQPEHQASGVARATSAPEREIQRERSEERQMVTNNNSLPPRVLHSLPFVRSRSQ